MSTLRVRKYGAHVQVSRETLVAFGLAEATPEEQAELDAWRGESDQRRAAATEAWPGFVAALAAVTDPVARIILDLHMRQEDGTCTGCDAEGYEWEYPSWPCRTTTTVAEAVGITVSEDLHMAEQAQA